MKKRLALATVLLIASLMIARVSSEGNEERWLTYKQDATLEGTLLNENKMSYSSSSGDSSAIQCPVFSLNQTLHTI